MPYHEPQTAASARADSEKSLFKRTSRLMVETENKHISEMGMLIVSIA